MPTTDKPLAGLRIVEVSSFVASPLAGLTLSQLGADVTRVDPIGGAADVHRWPVTADGESIYWTGLNKGKHSRTVDLRSEEGQDTVRRLVTAPGEGGGILLTNQAGRSWMSHESLAALRPDVITVEILGRTDGTPGVDYTVNAGVGFPMITGPVDHAGVVNHVLPAWDIACGLYAALAISSAVRRRERTGVGAHISLPLEDTALSIASTLGYLTEPQVTGHGREGTGNAVYGTFGTDVATSDGGRFMLVALTPRHFRDLVELAGVTDAVAAVETALDADFRSEADRFTHRAVLTALIEPWFARHTSAEATAALTSSSVLWEQYRSFSDVVDSGVLSSNPMFAELDQPGIGRFLAAGHPASFDGEHYFTGPASELGADNER